MNITGLHLIEKCGYLHVFLNLVQVKREKQPLFINSEGIQVVLSGSKFQAQVGNR